MPAAIFDDESVRLRALVSSDARVFFTPHALSEMAKDGIVPIDVEDMLCQCTVTRIADSQGETSWRAEGEDFDGRSIAAIVVPYENAKPPYLKIVTSWVNK